MKKNLFGWLAMTAMLVGTGCSTDEVVNDYSPENAIQFGTYVGQSASGRASVLTNDALKKQGFGVFASYTNTANFQVGDAMNFMNNTQVTYQGGAWTYSPLKYWPNNNDAKVSFFAYAPYNKEYNLIDNNTGIEYTVPTDIQKQIDLTWNNAEVIDLTKQSVNGTVDFKFQHALSKIDLTIQAATNELNPQANALDKNTVINVKEVILCGGTSTQKPKDGDVETTCVANLHSKGILQLNNTGREASWTIKASENSYTLTEGNFKTKQLNSENTPIAQELSNESLMILPQKFDDNGFCVYIHYEVVTTGRNANGVDDNSTINNMILTPVKDLNFESGKQYKLNLILGMTSVKVTANVANWVSNSGANVDLPLNKQ